MALDRNNKLWPETQLTSDWQKHNFLCIFNCSVNSLLQAPSSRNDRDSLALAVARCSNLDMRHAGDHRRWEREKETRHLLADRLSRLSHLLQAIVTHPQLSAEAHCISLYTNFKTINSNAHLT